MTSADLFAAAIRSGHEVVELNADQKRCVDTLAAIGRIHNIPFYGSAAAATKLLPDGISVLVQSELATYDGDELTALVVAAHRDHVRVAVRAWTWVTDEERAGAVHNALADLYDEPGCYGFADMGPEEIQFAALEIRLTARAVNSSLYDGLPGLDALIERSS